MSMSLKNGNAARQIDLRMGCGERLKSLHTPASHERPASNGDKASSIRRARLTGGDR